MMIKFPAAAERTRLRSQRTVPIFGGVSVTPWTLEIARKLEALKATKPLIIQAIEEFITQHLEATR